MHISCSYHWFLCSIFGLKTRPIFFVMLCSHPLEIFVFRMFDKDYIKIAKIPKLPNGNTKKFQNYIKLQSLLLCKLITPTYGLLFQSSSRQSSNPWKEFLISIWHAPISPIWRYKHNKVNTKFTLSKLDASLDWK